MRTVQGVHFTGWQWFRRQIRATISVLLIELAWRLWPEDTESDRAVVDAMAHLIDEVIEHDKIEVAK